MEAHIGLLNDGLGFFYVPRILYGDQNTPNRIAYRWIWNKMGLFCLRLQMKLELLEVKSCREVLIPDSHVKEFLYVRDNMSRLKIPRESVEEMAYKLLDLSLFASNDGLRINTSMRHSLRSKSLDDEPKEWWELGNEAPFLSSDYCWREKEED